MTRSIPAAAVSAMGVLDLSVPLTNATHKREPL